MADYVDIPNITILLQNREAPWQLNYQPGRRFLPYNPVNNRPYKAINSVILAAASDSRGYGDLRWITADQAARLGGTVRDGERPTKVAKWITHTTDEQGNKVPLNRPAIVLASVYNASQIDGLPPEPERPILPMAERQAAIANIIQRSGATIERIDGLTLPKYSRERDTILLAGGLSAMSNPVREQQQLVRQMAAWTGHSTRFDRESGPPGSLAAAREELRVSLGAMYAGDRMQIGYTARLDDDITARWVEMLERDRTDLLRAAMHAEVIANDIVDFSRPQARELDQERMQALARQVASERGQFDHDLAEEEQIVGQVTDNLPQVEQHMPEQGPQQRAEPVRTFPEDPRIQFGDALRKAGFVIEGLPVMDGEIHRVPVATDKGRDTSGAYQGHLDGVPNGWFQNFAASREGKDDSKQKWKATGVYAKLTPEQKAALIKEAEENKEAKRLALEMKHNAAAAQVREIWKGASHAESHPYLEAKGVYPSGERIGKFGQTMRVRARKDGKEYDISLKGKLLVPMWNENRELRSLQVIDDKPDEYGKFNKTFWPGGQAEGAFRVIGKLDAPGPKITLEGNATGETVHEATGYTVFIAFTNGNLERTAKIAMKLCPPDAEHYIAGDNDWTRQFERLPNGKLRGNPGKEAALQAASNLRIRALIPEFSKGDEGRSDFNDLKAKFGDRGLDEVRRQIDIGIQTQKVREKAAELTKERLQQETERKRGFFRGMFQGKDRPREVGIER